MDLYKLSVLEVLSEELADAVLNLEDSLVGRSLKNVEKRRSAIY